MEENDKIWSQLSSWNKLRRQICIIFLVVPDFGNSEIDTLAKPRIDSCYPDRDVYLIEMLSSYWIAGGGVHCHTNDQLALYIDEKFTIAGHIIII